MSVTTFANGIPVLSIPVSIASAPSTFASLPWNGVNKPYEWTCTLAVTAQPQSGVNTRQKLTYNGQDINVGHWIANISSGLAWQIISITSKTSTSVTCVIQDTFRYNTYRDPTKTGNGKPLAASYVVFELATNGTPLIDPAPTGIGANFLSTLIARFAYNNQEQYDFPLSQPGLTTVSFNPGDILAIDEPTQTFVEADTTHKTTTIGQVTAVDDTGKVFTVNPIGKIVDNFNSLPGQVGQFLYIDNSNPGQLTTTSGGAQIYLKIRNTTQSSTTSSTFGSATSVITTVGFTFNVNGVLATVSGTGTLTDVNSAINATTTTSGVSSVVTGSFFLQITAVDARGIAFEDISGSTTLDAGLTSAENGVKGAVIVVTSTASGSSPPAGLTNSYGFVFVKAVAATTWTIAHNAGTTNVSAQIYNASSGGAASGNIILPDEISIIDINNIQVTFQSAQAGTALLNILL